MYDDNQIRTCPNNFKFTVCLKVVDTPVLPMLAVSPELPHNQRLQEAPGAAEKLGCLPAWSDRQQKSDSEETEDTEKKDERWWKAVKSNKGYIYIYNMVIYRSYSLLICVWSVWCVEIAFFPDCHRLETWLPPCGQGTQENGSLTSLDTFFVSQRNLKCPELTKVSTLS